jgi:hypothetical protein
MKYLDGKKTYIVGGLLALYGLLGLLLGRLTSEEAYRLVLEGLGFITLRQGIAKLTR